MQCQGETMTYQSRMSTRLIRFGYLTRALAAATATLLKKQYPMAMSSCA